MRGQRSARRGSAERLTWLANWLAENGDDAARELASGFQAYHKALEEIVALPENATITNAKYAVREAFGDRRCTAFCDVGVGRFS